MQDVISTETSSQTAVACEQAALFGATPGPGESDPISLDTELA